MTEPSLKKLLKNELIQIMKCGHEIDYYATMENCEMVLERYDELKPRIVRMKKYMKKLEAKS